MKVAFSGSRKFADRTLVQNVLRRLYVKYPDLHVSVGDATGLDQLVRKECGDHGIPYKVYYAHWTELKGAAGHERNGRVVTGCNVLFAFFDKAGPSPGTSDAIGWAARLGVPVYVWHASLRKWAEPERQAV